MKKKALRKLGDFTGSPRVSGTTGIHPNLSFPQLNKCCSIAESYIVHWVLGTQDQQGVVRNRRTKLRTPWSCSVTIPKTQPSRAETENKEPLIPEASFMQPALGLLKTCLERMAQWDSCAEVKPGWPIRSVFLLDLFTCFSVAHRHTTLHSLYRIQQSLPRVSHLPFSELTLSLVSHFPTFLLRGVHRPHCS